MIRVFYSLDRDIPQWITETGVTADMVVYYFVFTKNCGEMFKVISNSHFFIPVSTPRDQIEAKIFEKLKQDYDTSNIHLFTIEQW